MIDLAPPPPLYVPARPAIIRAHQADLDALSAVEREHGIRAMLPGMVPVVVVATQGGAFPLIPDTPTTATTGGDTISLSIPGTAAAGDLLLAFATARATATRTVTTPSGWSVLYSDAGAGNLRRAVCFYKFAAGGETSVSIVFSASVSGAAIGYRITGAGDVSTPSRGSGTSSTASFPAHSPSWGSKKTLWLATVHAQNAASSSPPTNYTNQVTVDSFGSAGVLSQRRELEAASETPAAVSLSASVNWVAATVAIEPA